jgi:hypothetical protein
VNEEIFEEEIQDIDLRRARSLYIKYPDVVATPDLVGTMDFLMTKFGRTTEQLGKIVYRTPQLLQYDVSTLHKKGTLLCRCSGITTRVSRKEQVSHVSHGTHAGCLYSIDFIESGSKVLLLLEKKSESSGIATACCGRPQISSLTLESNLKPKIEYLREMGVSDEGIPELLVAFPQGLRKSLADRIRPGTQTLMNRE